MASRDIALDNAVRPELLKTNKTAMQIVERKNVPGAMQWMGHALEKKGQRIMSIRVIIARTVAPSHPQLILTHVGRWKRIVAYH